MPVYDYHTNNFVGMIDMLDITKVIAELHWKCIAQSKLYREADMYITYNGMSVQEILDQHDQKHVQDKKHFMPSKTGPGLKIYDDASLATVA
ncbi:hypothetical protein HK096_005775, partial [Nowakowskiella sp. JEL0078]